MKIFISHKMPNDTKAITSFAELLALYGGRDIVVLFAKGSNYKVQIETEIISSDIFILFLSNSDYDWTFCILERGLFRTTMLTSPNKRLIVVRGATTV